MTADSQLTVQVAVLTALRGASALTDLLTDGASAVRDHVPEGSAYPYVALGESRASRFDCKTEEGMEQALTIHSWSRHRGMKELKAIMAAIVDALDGQDLAITGHHLILIHFESSETRLEKDGLTRHGLQRFRVLTQVA